MFAKRPFVIAALAFCFAGGFGIQQYRERGAAPQGDGKAPSTSVSKAAPGAPSFWQSGGAGSGDESVPLMPYPLDSDPPGYCSRFYGQADWVRGGGMHHGWLREGGPEGPRHAFDWNRCWQGGQRHGPMWSEMGEHRRMGPGHGHGHPGGPRE